MLHQRHIETENRIRHERFNGREFTDVRESDTLRKGSSRPRRGESDPWCFEALMIILAAAFCYFVGSALLTGIDWLRTGPLGGP